MKVNLQFLYKAAGLLVIAAGVIVLTGWFFDIPAFISVFPGLISMRFNTAVCFIISGFALYLLHVTAISKRRRTVIAACAWIVLLAGLVHISEYLFGWNIGTDEFLWKEDPGTTGVRYPGRMSLLTAVNFTLLGFIFLVLSEKKYYWYLQSLLIVMIAACLLIICNNLFGDVYLSAIQQMGTTALHTAILFIVLCLGILGIPPLVHRRLAFMKKVITVFAVVSLFIGMILFTFFGNIRYSIETGRLLKKANQLIYLAEEVDVNVYQMQSSITGYIITGQESYLPLFSSSVKTADSILRQLKILTTGNIIRQHRIEKIERNLNRYIVSRNELINIRRSEGLEAARKYILNNDELLLINEMASVHRAIKEDELRLVKQRQAESEQTFRISSGIIIFLGIASTLLLLSAFITIYFNKRSRSKAELALQKSAKRIADIRYALDESTIVAITDQNGIIREVNNKFCSISKYSREELIGQDHRIINSGFHPEEFFREMWVTVSNGKVWRGEIKNKAKDGTYFWLDSTIIPFLDEQGNPYQYVAIRSVITERKNLEIEIKELNQDLQKRVDKKANEIVEKEFFLRESQRAGNIGSYKVNFITGRWQSSETLDAIFGIDENYNRTLPGWLEIVHPEDRQMMGEHLSLEIIANRKSFGKEYRIVRNNDQQTRWVQGYGEIKYDNNGNISELIGTVQDVSDKKKAEETILMEKALSDSIINSLPGLLYLIDEKGKILRWNNNLETASGYSASEISSMHPLDFIDVDSKQLVKDKINEAFTLAKSDAEAMFITKTNDKAPYYFISSRIIYEGKICLIGIGLNITKRKKVEASLFDSQQRYKNLLDNINDGFIVDDISSKVIFANKKFLEIFGFTSIDKKSIFLEDYVAPKYCKQIRDWHMSRMAGEVTSDAYEFEGVRVDGKSIWLEVHVNPIIENNIVTGTQSIIRDITESRKAAIALSESEETFRRLFNESADPILIIENFRFAACNKAAISNLGYSSNLEIIDKNPWNISPEKQPDGRLSFEKAKANIAKAVQLGYNRFEWMHIKYDGSELPVEVTLTPIILRGKQLIYVMWRDIAERKRAEKRIQESNERYEFVNKATRDTIWEWNFATNEGLWGDGIIHTFGYSEAHLKYGKKWRDEYVHLQDREELERKLHTCIESGIESWQHEYRFRCADGSFKNVSDRGFILFNKHGKPMRMIGSMSDITERKILEKEIADMAIKKQRMITEITIQAQENERNELGRELHDNINQILATIKMFLGMAKANKNIDADLLGKSYDYVDQAMIEIRKLSHSLVAPTLGDIGLHEALQELVDEINISDHLHLELTEVKNCTQHLDKEKKLMIYRIVQEQVNNIIKYSGAKKAEISLENIKDSIHLTIADNGIGFDAAKTSKGIGLKNIQIRLNLYSGNMNIITSPGKGCTLKINFPVNASNETI